jgi:hypothetical protein
MRIFPRETWEFTTGESAEELLLRLSEEVHAGFVVFSPRRRFRGTLDDATFTLMRNLTYRNSWAPVLCGQFLPQAQGTTVLATLRLNRFVMIFMAVWLAVPAALFIAFTMAAFAGGLWWLPLAPLGMFTIALTVSRLAFWYEVPHTKAHFLFCLKLDPHTLKTKKSRIIESPYIQEDEA